MYQLSEKLVLKLPYQYPVNKAPSREDAEEQLDMSLRSLALFRKEVAFYNLLDRNPHPNLAQRVPSKQISSIVLESFRSLQSIWKPTSRDMHLLWVMQLVYALEWLEGLGYTHGDLKIDNMGIDEKNQLRLFDFGSVRRYDEDGFDEQVLEDHFSLATCIHFLVCGTDPLARVESYAELRRRQADLKGGHGVVEEAARDFEQVVQAGWKEVPRPASSFSELRKTIARIIGDIDSIARLRPENVSSSLGPVDIVLVKQDMWLDEVDYRAAWVAQGYKVEPDDVYI